MAPVRAQSWAFGLSLGPQALGVAVAGSGGARPLTIGKHGVGRPRLASCAFLVTDWTPQQRRPLPSPHVNSSQAAQASSGGEIGALFGQKGETLRGVKARDVLAGSRGAGGLSVVYIFVASTAALHGVDIGGQ